MTFRIVGAAAVASIVLAVCPGHVLASTGGASLPNPTMLLTAERTAAASAPWLHERSTSITVNPGVRRTILRETTDTVGGGATYRAVIAQQSVALHTHRSTNTSSVLVTIGGQGAIERNGGAWVCGRALRPQARNGLQPGARLLGATTINHVPVWHIRYPDNAVASGESLRSHVDIYLSRRNSMPVLQTYAGRILRSGKVVAILSGTTSYTTGPSQPAISLPVACSATQSAPLRLTAIAGSALAGQLAPQNP